MIIVDATPLQSEHKVRGVGSYTRHLCNELAKADAANEVRFVLERTGQQDLPMSLRSHSVSVWRPHKPAQVYWMYNEFMLRQALASSRPSLFHATDFNGVITSPLYKTVATLHDLTGLVPSDTGLSPSLALSNLRWYVYYHHKILRADHLIAVSQFVKDDVVAKLEYPDDKVTVIPHGVDTQLYQPARGQGRFAAQNPYIAYVGSAEEHKNVKRLWAAFANVASEHPNLSLLMCGRWQKEQLDWLEAESRATGLLAKVKHLGFLSSEDQVSLLANASAFVFPSLSEGFGLPVLEAMACGTPVITSNCSVLPEVAGDAALLVDPQSVEEIAAGIRRLLTDNAYAEELIRRGYRRAQDFSWKQTAAKTMEVYQQVLAEDSRAPRRAYAK